MPTLEDVRGIAMTLPGTSEKAGRTGAQWRVGERMFVWERPLRPRELETLDGPPPAGPILGVHVEHLLAKEALLAQAGDVYFTTSHFDGHPSILVRLDAAGIEELHELVVEAWLSRAPKPLAGAYLAENPPS